MECNEPRRLELLLWSERDRICITLSDEEKILYEVWDEEVIELIEDGFIRTFSYQTVEKYLREKELIKYDDIVEYR